MIDQLEILKKQFKRREEVPISKTESLDSNLSNLWKGKTDSYEESVLEKENEAEEEKKVESDEQFFRRLKEA